MWIDIHPHPDLARARTHAASLVDEAAEAARLRYITPGAGQALEYEAAAKEARQYMAATPGDAAQPTPMLQAQVDANVAQDLGSAAATVLAASEQWATIGAEIRRLRLAGKHAIATAATHAEIVQARTATIAALEDV